MNVHALFNYTQSYMLFEGGPTLKHKQMKREREKKKIVIQNYKHTLQSNALVHALHLKTFLSSFPRHIPKAKATTIAETPELKRIAENTKIQSNVQYHAEFEKAKGKLTQVSRCEIRGRETNSIIKSDVVGFSIQIADDPETLRIKQNTRNISNVAYHGEIQKKAAMERQRELTDVIDIRGKCRVQEFL